MRQVTWLVTSLTIPRSSITVVSALLLVQQLIWQIIASRGRPKQQSQQIGPRQSRGHWLVVPVASNSARPTTTSRRTPATLLLRSIAWAARLVQRQSISPPRAAPLLVASVALLEWTTSLTRER